MGIRNLMRRGPAVDAPVEEPVEMKPRLPRQKPAAAPKPARIVTVVPDGQPLVFTRLQGERAERIETEDVPAALADLRGHAWQISTLDGKVIVMNQGMHKALSAGLKL